MSVPVRPPHSPAPGAGTEVPGSEPRADTPVAPGLVDEGGEEPAKAEHNANIKVEPESDAGEQSSPTSPPVETEDDDVEIKIEPESDSEEQSTTAVETEDRVRIKIEPKSDSEEHKSPSVETEDDVKIKTEASDSEESVSEEE